MTLLEADGPAGTVEEDTVAAQAHPRERRARLVHHRASRWMHWINFPLLTVMIWSGMRIYWADLRDPFAVGISDFDFEFWPAYINESLGLQRRLARGMAFHFTFGWLFAINGLLYVLYTAFSGEWRQLLPERKSFSDAAKVALHDIGIGRKNPLPPQARYNGAQRITYTLVILMGALVVYSGLAIYKPTQLSFMTTSLGGYEWARGIHFAVTIGFMVFFAVHMAQVLANPSLGWLVKKVGVIPALIPSIALAIGGLIWWIGWDWTQDWVPATVTLMGFAFIPMTLLMVTSQGHVGLGGLWSMITGYAWEEEEGESAHG